MTSSDPGSCRTQPEDEPLPHRGGQSGAGPWLGVLSSAHPSTALPGLHRHSQNPWGLRRARGLEKKEAWRRCYAPTSVFPPRSHPAHWTCCAPSSQVEGHGSVWTEGLTGAGGLQESPGVCVPPGPTSPAQQTVHAHASEPGPALGVPWATAKVG